jgi:hypothetical protein
MAQPYEGDSSDPNVLGLKGVSHAANGGVVGVNDWAAAGQPLGSGGNGGWFESLKGEGVRGWSKNPNHGGVVGVNTAGGIGAFGQSDVNSGVVGESTDGIGVFGESKTNEGVRGVSHSAHGGVVGVNDWAAAGQPPGSGGNGGWFESLKGEGVRGWSKNPDHGGVVGINTAGGIAIFGSSNGVAGHFEGNVEVTGKIDAPKSTITWFDVSISNADCAEDFNIGIDVMVDPGTVMVLGEDGELFPSLHAYDKRVAGVISGAGDYKPGIVLDRQKSVCNRQPVALLGKVFCKVDAQYGAIEVGDLLTTSPTPGHAMRATDARKAFGTVIGKALLPLKKGQGLIPILIALQ